MSDTNVSAPTSAEPTATPSAPAAAPTPAAATAAPAASATTPAAPSAPTTGGAPEGWVPSYRVRETREAAIREAQSNFERKEAEYRQQLERVQSQLHALVGVQPPPNPEVNAVKSQFGQLYPGLAQMEERANDILGILERAGDLEAQGTHYWQNYGRQSMDRLFSHAQESMGGQLSDDAKRVLHSSFVGFVSSSPELTARYAEDPTIVEDFWKAFSQSFIDPSRRVAAANVATRAAGVPTPQDTAARAPAVPGAPKPANMDERAATAWALYNQNAKQ